MNTYFQVSNCRYSYFLTPSIKEGKTTLMLFCLRCHGTESNNICLFKLINHSELPHMTAVAQLVRNLGLGSKFVT